MGVRSQADHLRTGRGWSDRHPGRTTASPPAGSVCRNSGSTGRIVLHARDPPQVTAPAPWWNTVALRIRDDLSDNASRLDGDAAGLLPGLVVGDTSGISERLDADAKTTGVTHLLAVSGSHFAILCGMVVVVLRRFGPRTAAVGGTLTLVGLGDPGRAGAVGPARGGDGRDRDARAAGRSNAIVRAGAGGSGDRPAAHRPRAGGQRGVRAVRAGDRRADPHRAGLVGIVAAQGSSAGLGGSAGCSGCRADRHDAGHRVDQRVGLGRRRAGQPAGRAGGRPGVGAGRAVRADRPVVAGRGAAVSAQLVAPLLSWIAGVAHTLARWPNATVPVAGHPDRARCSLRGCRWSR